MTNLIVKDREIGPGRPVYIVAELSGNHHGELGRAKALVAAAAAAGVDAVKLQTYTADTLTIASTAEPFRIGGGTLWDGAYLHELYGQAATPWEWQAELRDEIERHGLDFFSAPFDATAVDFLEDLGCPCYKIASPELIDHALIRKAAATGKPLILSTGMASLGEIDEAVSVATSSGAAGVALLRCNSSYPAPPEEMDLRTISHMAAAWGVPVGLSDHTLGIAAAVVAVAFGASIIEKHLTLSRSEPGPDAAFSLEPHEFADLVRSVREAESAVGDVRYGPSPHEHASLRFRRSLFIVKDVRAGEVLTSENVRSIRPADGLAPKFLEVVLGRRAVRDVASGTPVAWDLLA
jgi:N-acetylneuraminate synthase